MKGPLLVRAACYVRVSRLDQNPGLQEDETLEFITRRGWEKAGVFKDHGISGSRERRPELDRMLLAAKRKKFDVLVVWRSDRLFRSLRHMVLTLDELTAYGIGFVSVTEPFDTTTPQGRLLVHLVSAFGEFEKSILIERTRAGLAAARRRGKRLGRPPVHVDVERALVLRAEGKSIRHVAKELGVSVGTIQKTLAAGASGSVQETPPQEGPRGLGFSAEDGAPWRGRRPSRKTFGC